MVAYFWIHSMGAYFVKTIHVILTELTTTSTTSTTEVKETSIDDLPVEVVSLIGSSLFARDRACFRAVCKTWRCSIPPAPRSVQLDEMVKFPHMYMGCEGSLRQFYHPILNTTHFDNAKQFEDSLFKRCYTRRGQYIWNRITGCNNIEFLASHTNPVFHRGLFFCLGRNGNLATFDPKHSAWTVLIKPEKPCTEIWRNYLVDCDGDLISVFEGHVGNAIEIFKMDYSVMAW
ncbi:hypothetical protein LguiA_007586 [Lonicera macranthoides]